MTKSTRKYSVNRGPGIQAMLKDRAKAIITLETDDIKIALGYWLGSEGRFMKVASCTNAKRHEWTTITVDPNRIKHISKLGGAA